MSEGTAMPGARFLVSGVASRAGPFGAGRKTARRRFLAACASVTLSAIAIHPARATGGAVDTASDDGPAGVLLRDPEATAELGRRYLATRRGEANAGWLRGVTGAARNGRLPPNGSLSRRVRADFATGDTVTVDGWVIARTEARFCALVAIALSRRKTI